MFIFLNLDSRFVINRSAVRIRAGAPHHLLFHQNNLCKSYSYHNKCGQSVDRFVDQSSSRLIYQVSNFIKFSSLLAELEQGVLKQAAILTVIFELS